MGSHPADARVADNEDGQADTGTDAHAELTQRLAHAEDQWRRSAADLDNLQKRYAREVQRGRLEERERVLKQWIQTMDDLDRAVEFSEPGHNPVVDGIHSILDRARAAIASMGYERFGAVGEQFDPAIHEVVSTLPASAATPENQIVAVVKPGYRSADRVLRAAAVVVAAEAP